MNKIITLVLTLLLSAFASQASNLENSQNMDEAPAIPSKEISDYMNMDDFQDMTAPSPAEPQKSTSTKTNGSEETYVYRSMQNLAVFPLINKYKRSPKTRLSVIQNANNHVMVTLDVNGDPNVVKEIDSLVKKDKKNATNVITTFNENSDDYVIKVATEEGDVSIMYNTSVDGDRCSLTITGPCKNFNI